MLVKAVNKLFSNIAVQPEFTVKFFETGGGDAQVGDGSEFPPDHDGSDLNLESVNCVDYVD